MKKFLALGMVGCVAAGFVLATPSVSQASHRQPFGIDLHWGSGGFSFYRAPAFHHHGHFAPQIYRAPYGRVFQPVYRAPYFYGRPHHHHHHHRHHFHGGVPYRFGW